MRRADPLASNLRGTVTAPKSTASPRFPVAQPRVVGSVRGRPAVGWAVVAPPRKKGTRSMIPAWSSAIQSSPQPTRVDSANTVKAIHVAVGAATIHRFRGGWCCFDIRFLPGARKEGKEKKGRKE